MQNSQLSLIDLRQQVHSDAAFALEKNFGIGTLNIDTGVGKSKIAIDFINRHPEVKRVLITSPRENLKANWATELSKWLDDIREVVIVVENIQTCYRWENEKFDLIIMDEVHMIMTPEYIKILANNTFTYIIGLTATLDIKGKLEKRLLYSAHCPIIYRYNTAEEDGVVNKVRVVIIEHTLDDNFKVLTGGKTKKWLAGEAKTYAYISEMYDSAFQGMRQEMQLAEYIASVTSDDLTPELQNLRNLSDNVYEMANQWGYKALGNVAQKAAAMKYMQAMMIRKNFLLNLSSTQAIATKICQRLLKNPANKILVFSELTAQADKISAHTVHSKNHPRVNTKNIQDFNDGDIRQLGSCYSLTLGLNLSATNIGIFESFMSSDTKSMQRIGRLHRLPNSDEAILYVIKVMNTQSESWFSQLLSTYSVDKTIDSLLILNA